MMMTMTPIMKTMMTKMIMKRTVIGGVHKQESRVQPSPPASSVEEYVRDDNDVDDNDDDDDQRQQQDR